MVSLEHAIGAQPSQAYEMIVIAKIVPPFYAWEEWQPTWRVFLPGESHEGLAGYTVMGGSHKSDRADVTKQQQQPLYATVLLTLH